MQCKVALCCRLEGCNYKLIKPFQPLLCKEEQSFKEKHMANF